MTVSPEIEDATEEYRQWRSGLVAEAPWSPDGEDEFHGPHVAMRRASFEAIEWQKLPEWDTPVRGPAARLRVLAQTCECRATVHAFCALGGAYFIRRTLRGPDGEQSWDSPHTRQRKAERLWWLLLRGQAR
ncbi:hypothetical protein [Spirillospora sp. NPDC029432]|uniref:hypothetical protein n=1 Tax=Spirillospora sp. NPDC029432 TaxID=3154599 RepID=UPI003451ECAB